VTDSTLSSDPASRPPLTRRKGARPAAPPRTAAGNLETATRRLSAMKFRTLLVVALLATAAAAVTSWRLRASAYTKPPATPGTWHPTAHHQ